MKKVAVFAAALLAGTIVSAEISVGADGHGLVNIVDKDYTKTEYDSALGMDDETDSPDSVSSAEFVGALHFSGNTEDEVLGFNLDLEYTVTGTDLFGTETDDEGNTVVTSNLALSDEAKVWWKPADWFLGQVGMIEVDDLRGSVGDWGVGRRDVGSLDEDMIFDRFYPKAGLALSFYPVEGLFVGATFDTKSGEYDTEDFFKHFNAGIGYTLDALQLKFAYFGESEDYYEDYKGKLEFGVKYDINETNLVELGVKVPLWTDDDSRLDAAITQWLADDPDKEIDYNTNSFQVVLGFQGESDNLVYKAHAGYMGCATSDDEITFYGGKLGYNPTLTVDGGIEIGFEHFALGATAQYMFMNNSTVSKTMNLHFAAAEIYIKKDIVEDCFVFAGVADEFSFTEKEDTFKQTTNKVRIPVGIEFAF